MNFTFDDDTVALLDTLAKEYYNGNKSSTVRAALESLATHLGHAGWVIAGYTPVQLDHQMACHECGTPYGTGEVLYRPVFERGRGESVLSQLPAVTWLACPKCIEKQ
ncbi:MAG TPA: hypothetical protein VGK81_12095 [Anaerolineae bacterium]